ncbi:thioredoxin [Pseudonocardia acidicola]|uniref:Thioredoxin n=1 Tax=Pseudonocardia acidicola TaxID=2724939 RepID=A0ABX1SHD3_9PSEU|nr:thioredoxin [Pseudonocardia acidicola]NMH99796.1 thioredoxin [Pseudonocardia acidicola]
MSSGASGTGTVRKSVVTCPHCGRRNRVPAAADSIPKCGNCHNPLPWIVDAGDDDFAEIAERSPVPVVIDMWATWCGPCRMVSPALEQLAIERAGQIKLVKVDVDRSPRLSARFEIRAVPTLMVMRGGEVIARQPGAAPVHVLRNWLDEALGATGQSTAASGPDGSIAGSSDRLGQENRSS